MPVTKLSWSVPTSKTVQYWESGQVAGAEIVPAQGIGGLPTVEFGLDGGLDGGVVRGYCKHGGRREVEEAIS